MNKPIYLLNGPNLNMLGQREPGIYGHETLDDIKAKASSCARELGLDLDFRQSNHEGVLVDWLHEAHVSAAGVILNAGALTHTSLALGDAVSAIAPPVIELHISNVHRRENFRHFSYISAPASGIIVGFGTMGYELAVRAMFDMLRAKYD